jgi:hypothetical protein
MIVTTAFGILHYLSATAARPATTPGRSPSDDVLTAVIFED